jgi:hypothetical protein
MKKENWRILILQFSFSLSYEKRKLEDTDPSIFFFIIVRKKKIGGY